MKSPIPIANILIVAQLTNDLDPTGVCLSVLAHLQPQP